MKKLTILILAAICMLSSECLETMVGDECGLSMWNTSGRTIAVYGTYIQKDTILPINYPEFHTIYHSSSLVSKLGNPTSTFIMSDHHNWVRSLSESDTVRIFIFDKEYLDNNDWSTVREEYSILRYDLTLQNVHDFGNQLFYPPTPEMKDIKMWPPYEEVIRQQEMDKPE